MLYDKFKEMARWSFKETTNEFLRIFACISKLYEVKDKDTVKIVVYRRKGQNQMITITHPDKEFENLKVDEPNKDEPKEFYLISKDTLEKKYTIRLLENDPENEVSYFLMKPETRENENTD